MTKRSIRLGGLVTVLGTVAAVAETCSWFKIEPQHIGRPIQVSIVCVGDTVNRAVRWMRHLPEKHNAVESVSGEQPAHLVLIIENQGDVDSINHVKSLISEIANRLLPTDSVSLITFTNDSQKYRFIFTNEPGKTAAGRLVEKAQVLFPLSTIEPDTVQAASKAAWKHLEPAIRTSTSIAVIELSTDTSLQTLEDEFRKLRSVAPIEAAVPELILGSRKGKD